MEQHKPSGIDSLQISSQNFPCDQPLYGRLTGEALGEVHNDVLEPALDFLAQRTLLPDGSQKSLGMKYDPADKHYTAKLPGAAPGEYKVAILSDIAGQKVNARYNFKQ